MLYFLLLTAFTVSIDSFFCIFTLSLNGKRKFQIIPIIAITVFIMCLITNYLAKLFAPYLTERTANLGGIILVAIGIYNLLTCDKEVSLTDGKFTKQAFLVGVAVGLDGAAANLSLSILGINAFYVPVIIALTHAFASLLGVLLSSLSNKLSFERLKFISPLLLILLGGYKLTCFFL